MDNNTPQRGDPLTWLSVLITVLALFATSIGLFWQNASESVPFTNVYGQTVELYGRGLYAYDTVFVGAGSRATDSVTLFLGIPLLLVCLLLYRRGTLRGALLLLGTIAYFLYVYASYALGSVTYNSLFLVYVVLFSSSLYAVVLGFMQLEHWLVASSLSPHLPRRIPAYFMFASGVITLFVWLTPLLAALVQGQPPDTIGSYTGRVTDALDLSIITPATFISSTLILKRRPLGYIIALSLLILEILLLPLITMQTVFQLAAGVSFTPGEIIGPIGGFMVLGLLAFWVTLAILKNVSLIGCNYTNLP